jgi:hypothetical protein
MCVVYCARHVDKICAQEKSKQCSQYEITWGNRVTICGIAFLQRNAVFVGFEKYEITSAIKVDVAFNFEVGQLISFEMGASAT